jgi:hypothetical protein
MDATMDTNVLQHGPCIEPPPAVQPTRDGARCCLSKRSHLMHPGLTAPCVSPRLVRQAGPLPPSAAALGCWAPCELPGWRSAHCHTWTSRC